MVVDEVGRRLGIERWKTKDGARQAYDAARRIVLVEPVTYMNNSGIPIRIIASWYKTPPEELLVVVDEMDIPFGQLRMRVSGGHAGHNGMRSVIATMGDAFPRIRIGVGRSEQGENIDFLLSDFSAAEREKLPEIVDAAASGVMLWLEDGPERAMQFVNTAKIA